MVAYPIAFLFHYMHSFVSKNKIFQNSPDEETPSYGVYQSIAVLFFFTKDL